MFETLELKPPDAILKLIAEHAEDPRDNKVDLGVGVYRDETGVTPVLKTVKEAEHWLVGTQDSKAYIGSRGDPRFCEQIEILMFGEAPSKAGRISTMQSPGGSGALRCAAELLLRTNPDTVIWVSDPTWNNHVPLIGEAGMQMRPYPYYDRQANALNFVGMMSALEEAQPGHIVLLHGCCHNPTGVDLDRSQWDQVIALIAERELLPLIDLAYQGFAGELEDDVYGVRAMYDAVPEMVVTQSCSKNFGLYRDRVGALSFVAADDRNALAVQSHAMQIVRTMYSLPPDHGAAIVAHILTTPDLRAAWEQELADMRARLSDMRQLLVDELADAAPERDFSHIATTTGMFCYLGLSAEQVGRLKKERGVYLVDSSRINICGITADNARYIAESIAAIL